MKTDVTPTTDVLVEKFMAGDSICRLAVRFDLLPVTVEKAIRRYMELHGWKAR